MNFEYLKKVELKKPADSSYITKQVDFKNGKLNWQNKVIVNKDSQTKLFFPEEINGYKYADFVHDFRIFLRSKNHLVSEPIILALVLIFVKLRNKMGFTQNAWTEFSLRMFTTCELHMEHLPPMFIEESDSTLNLRNYTIGKFENNSFKEKIKLRTKSDIYEQLIRIYKDEDNLSKLVSFKRIEEKITIIDINKLAKNLNLNLPDTYELIDLYLDAVSNKYFELFWDDLEKEIKESVIFGGAYYNPLHYRLLGNENSNQICIFTNFNSGEGTSSSGWVTPFRTPVMEIQLYSGIINKDLNGKLKDYYEKTDNQRSDFSKPIEIAIKYISNGLIGITEDKLGESLLNFWIALDTILNDDENEAKSNLLKNRITALTCHCYGKSHSSHYYLISELYKLRSEYIHAAIEPEKDKIIELSKVCQTVFEILVRMHTNNQIYEDLTLENWYKDIDELAQLGREKKKIDRDLLENVGIIEIIEN